MPVESIRGWALVTGGGGFLGSRLARALLQRGPRVRVLDVQRGYLEGAEDPRLEFLGVGEDALRGGMTDRGLMDAAVDGVDVVYHLAFNWDGGTWRHQLPLADLFDVNVRGTLNLLEAARNHGAKHFLYASSEAVYGVTRSRVVVEDDPCRPWLWDGDPGPAYAVLKLVLENLCLLYHRRYGLPVTVFRIRVAFDDQDALLLSAERVRRALAGEDVEVVEGRGRESIHVDEAVDAFLLATLNPAAYGQIFNLSNPSTYFLERELYERVVRLAGSKSRVIPRAETEASGPAFLSIEKVRRSLGWRPRKTRADLEDAIAATVERLRASK